jgi:hypothetical protein
VRDPARRERILHLIETIWGYDPDARLCQIIGNSLPGTSDKYHVEDDVLEEALEKLLDAYVEWRR